MKIQIEAIRFNHRPNSLNSDALNLRRNGSEFISVPEWLRGQTFNAEDSIAAYPLRETTGQPVTIQATFTATSPQFEVRIRALDATGANVLGEVAERAVNFAFGMQSQFETFALANTLLASVGVGSHLVKWRWQARIPPSSNWVNIGETNHRIFTVIEEPKLPWRKDPFHPRQSSASLGGSLRVGVPVAWGIRLFVTTVKMAALVWLQTGFYWNCSDRPPSPLCRAWTALAIWLFPHLLEQWFCSCAATSQSPFVMSARSVSQSSTWATRLRWRT